MTGISHQGCNFYFIIDILYLMRPDIKPFFHSLGMVSISSLRTLHLLWGIWLLSLTSGPLQKHFVLAAFFLCISHSPDSCVCVCVCVCVSQFFCCCWKLDILGIVLQQFCILILSIPRGLMFLLFVWSFIYLASDFMN
jgi:hypothetical protein